MDDILASIRRILHADDAAAVPAEAHPADPADEILDLDASMRVAETPSENQAGPPLDHRADFGHAEPSLDHPGVDWSAPTAAHAEPPHEDIHPHAALPADGSDEAADPLIGAHAAAESSASLATLREALAAREQRQQPEPASSGSIYRSGGLTIEDVVRDEVRVLLRDWLDDNLPPLVEKLVRAEIARISGQG